MRAEPRFKPLPFESATLLTEGKVDEAIKTVRRAEGLGQSEARERVDAHIAQDPLLRVQIEAQRRTNRRKFFLWFLLFDLVVTAGIIYWLFMRGPA